MGDQCGVPVAASTRREKAREAAVVGYRPFANPRRERACVYDYDSTVSADGGWAEAHATQRTGRADRPRQKLCPVPVMRCTVLYLKQKIEALSALCGHRCGLPGALDTI